MKKGYTIVEFADRSTWMIEGKKPLLEGIKESCYFTKNDIGETVTMMPLQSIKQIYHVTVDEEEFRKHKERAKLEKRAVGYQNEKEEP